MNVFECDLVALLLFIFGVILFIISYLIFTNIKGDLLFSI